MLSGLHEKQVLHAYRGKKFCLSACECATAYQVIGYHWKFSVYRAVDQWSNINALNYNLPYILALFETHFVNGKCDKTDFVTFSIEKMSFKQGRDVGKIAVQYIYVGPLVHCIDRNLYWLVLKHSHFGISHQNGFKEKEFHSCALYAGTWYSLNKSYESTVCY